MGHKWVIHGSHLDCSVGQMGQQVRPTFNPATIVSTKFCLSYFCVYSIRWSFSSSNFCTVQYLLDCCVCNIRNIYSHMYYCTKAVKEDHCYRVGSYNIFKKKHWKEYWSKTPLACSEIRTQHYLIASREHYQLTTNATNPTSVVLSI